MFCFFLLLAPIFSANKGTKVYFFQTCTSDTIGRREIRFNYACLGADFNSMNIDNGAILTYAQRPLQIAMPYELIFLENQFHYFPINRLITDFGDFGVFDPPSLSILEINTNEMTVHKFCFRNTMKNESIFITEITTTSREVYVEHVDNREIIASGKLDMNIVVCPTEPGFFNSILFFTTSKGVIPYSIAFHAISDPKDPFVQVISHLYTGMHANISIKMPPISSGKKLSVIFDSSLFDPSLCQITNRYIFMVAPMLSVSNIVTFVHLYTPTFSRSYPLYMTASSRMIQSYHPNILIPLVTTKDGQNEADIKIVNPTNFNINILSITLQSNAPANMKIEKQPPPMICSRNSHTSIGKVVVTGAIQGKIETSIRVEYEAPGIGVQSFDIAVHASVKYGSLVPSMQQVNLMSNKGNQSITFHNNFKVPVAFLAVRTDSLHYNVVNFKPFIIKPGEDSPPMTINVTKEFSFDSTEAMLHIVTNATHLKIPIHAYQGHITISDKSNQNSPNTKTLVKTMGKMLCGSTSNFTIYLTNPNPIIFNITDVKTSPGIEINDFWMNKTNQDLNNFQIPMLSESKISLYINFNSVSTGMYLKNRNDTITISGSGNTLTIIISWIPINGAFKIKTDFNSSIMFGKQYRTTVRLISNYNAKLRLQSVTSTLPIDITYDQQIIKKNHSIPVATLDFVLTDKIIDPSNVIKLHASQYSLQLTIDLHFHFRKTFFITKTIPIRVVFSQMNDMRRDLGVIYVGEERRIGFTIENKFAIPMKVVYHPKKESSFHLNTEIDLINPFDNIQITFNFVSSKEGYVHFILPVTTNLTRPFKIDFVGNVVYPSIYFSDKDGEEINTLNFDPWELEEHIYERAYIQNNCELPLIVTSISLIDPEYHLGRRTNIECETDCMDAPVPPYGNCSMTMEILPYTFQRQETDFSLYISTKFKINMTLKVHVRFTKAIFQKISARKKSKQLVAIVCALIVPVWSFLSDQLHSRKRAKEFEERLLKIDESIEALSQTNARSHVGTQATPMADEVTGGIWDKCGSEIVVMPNSEALMDLIEIIDMIS